MTQDPLQQLRDLRARHERELRRAISAALGSGATSQDLALALGMSRATLWRRYGEQLRRRGEHESRHAGAGDLATRHSRER